MPIPAALREWRSGYKDRSATKSTRHKRLWVRKPRMSETLAIKDEPIHVPEPAEARPSRIRNFDPLKPPTDKPQSYYDAIEQRFAEERDLRLGFRPEGKAQYITDLEDDADLARYETDPFAEQVVERAPLTDHVEVLCIGGGFSAL